jgi:isopentenyl-diphosphate delta-isomerase type 1
MTQTENVILVDEHDQPIGIEEKLAAHRAGKLHRAFSVFIVRNFNDNVEILLQQRQLHKYHSPGLWTNTCCSHPRPGESIEAAATRRLYEEMGIKSNLQAIGHFIYKAPFDNGLIEHELDHVLIGECHTPFQVNPEEVAATRWVPWQTLEADIESHPEHYTAWLKPALGVVKAYLFTHAVISGN